MSLAEAKSEPAPALKYKRVLLKISGEALMGDGQYGIDQATCERFAKEVLDARQAGAEISLVVGGGNIFRGLAGAAKGMERATADYMGMLATVMNALALHNALERQKTPARVLSAIPMPTVCESYVRPKALHHLERGRVVIFAAEKAGQRSSIDRRACRQIERGGLIIRQDGDERRHKTALARTTRRRR